MSRRNVCNMIEEIKGTKSTKIMELINRKLQKDKEGMLSKHIKDSNLNKIYLEFKSLKKTLDIIKKVLDKRKDELDLEWITYGNKSHYAIKDRCRISKEDYDLLQKAQDLFSIGKKTQAKEIWVRMIEKHKLFRK